ncbi:MAG: aspartate kinase [Thermoplasmata archaeon]|nr:aspartate kinase [Thermoplasmata archaeon]
MERRPVVAKFGGESMAEPDLVVGRIRTIRREGFPVVVVVSARAGVTDLLRRTLLREEGTSNVPALVADLAALHPGGSEEVGTVLDETARIARRVVRSPSPSPWLQDALLGQGERLSAHWFAAHLRSRKLPGTAMEADRIGLLTDCSYGAARILLKRSEKQVRANLGRVLRTGGIPVVTGYIGRSEEGRVATLGRGGSDYSASALGAILGAHRVELVKRNVAISTADPRLVPNAVTVRHLSYEEAEEIAQFGAKVLHPVAIEPAAARRVEIQVRSLGHRERATTIGPAREGVHARAVTLLGPLRSLNLRVAGGRQRPGLISEVSRLLVAQNINMAAVVTTEAVLGVLLDPADAARARVALEPLAADLGALLGHPTPVSLVSAVGEGILDELPRVPKFVLRGAGGLLATARSISIVVPQERATAALQRMHRTFVEGRNGHRRASPRAATSKRPAPSPVT